MNLLFEKTKEVIRTLLPVVILVLILCFTIVEVEMDIILRFLIGSIMLLIGLSIFLWGVDLSMNPIGEYMSFEIATSKSGLKIAVISFLLGFLITIAEPDLLILGSQVQSASGDTMKSFIIVYMVSIGVGVMVMLGTFNLLKGRPLNRFMAITYGIIFLLAIFVSEEFLAIAFDASGATTGALTTPFALAIFLGLSKVKGGKNTEENAFGLVGIMSSGPILAITLLSIISGQKNIQGEAGKFIAAKGIIKPIVSIIPTIIAESIAALLPIIILFFIFNFKKFKIPKGELYRIIKGVVLTLVGLVLFLTAVNSGFMDMGRIIGMQIAGKNKWLLVVIGFMLGFIVVLVEPAVIVLGEQIREVTGGHIPVNLIKITLSIGNALAIGLSMVRILIPQVKLWYFILPGFALAILLSFITNPIFVGIAYDAGGVASGPMTATFVLAFAQGAASVIETANVLVDGFGVIAMVAMAPVFSIMLLGTLFRHTKTEKSVAEEKHAVPSELFEEDNMQHHLIMAVVNRGFAENVVELARNSGAKGATILHGRGTEEHHKVLLPIINIELYPEKEIILLVTETNLSEQIADNLLSDSQLKFKGEISVYISYTEAMIKVS